jgi:flagellar hook-length control protein FliK
MPLVMDFSGEIIPQIVEQAGQLAMTGAEELRLRLQPEFLGEVLIRVRRLQGVLTAEIVAQDLAVRELLASQLEALRQRFQEVNLPVEHLSVSVQAEGEHGSASLAGDGGGHDFSGAAGTGGEGGGENAPEEEDGVLSPALWEAGQRVNYLA